MTLEGWKAGPFAAAALIALAAACSRGGQQPAPGAPATADHVLLITVDTLRADRVGAYGSTRASTPALDGIAKNGVRFDRAFATAPITQTSHASLLTGRYPAGHGARHNGMRISETVPTLAERFRAAGFATGAFVAAFPLDKRFGLARGFDTYSDTMPIGADGRRANERPGRMVVDEAIAWLRNQWNQGNQGNHGNQGNRVFLWVHLFEPHAPYGDPSNRAFAGLSASDRYDREIAEADAQIARLLAALGNRRARTLIVATADHGEAFGEHEEIGHSIFVYDATLRVPLIMEGPGISRGISAAEDVSLVDLATTIAPMARLGAFDGDGRDLSPALVGQTLPPRGVYSESLAPRLDFGWSPLRALRFDGWKYIEAPRAELYNLEEDPGELKNVAVSNVEKLREMAQRTRIGGPDTLPSGAKPSDPDGRLASLGYLSGSFASLYNSASDHRADPKDKIAVAAAIARITSGEARGPQLETALRAVLEEDPANPQMNLRLGYVLAESNRCPEARRRFDAAIRGKVPTADAHLGLASCQAAAREFDAAVGTLREAARVEPGNPVVTANLGLVLADASRPAEAIDPLQRALAADPDLHQARFGLALALARAGRRADAEAAARELLRRLPAHAPQRSEVERLLRALSTR